MITRVRYPQRNSEAGYMLLEALIAILVFAIGILGVVSLQAVSLKNVGAAKYRSDASMLVNQLIGQMWASDRSPDTLKAQFLAGGAAYSDWLTGVKNELPGYNASSPPPDPTVTVECLPNPACPAPPDTSSSRVTITVRWHIPGEFEKDPATGVPDPTKPIIHQYVAVAEMNAINN